MTEPLIYTTKGNVPVKDLRYEAKWEEKEGVWTKLIETYYMGDEIVKQNVHVLHRKGLLSEATGAKLS